MMSPWIERVVKFWLSPDTTGGFEAPKAKLARLIELTKGYLLRASVLGYLVHHCFCINGERDVTFYAAVANVA
jgi:hypothetical protein